MKLYFTKQDRTNLRDMMHGMDWQILYKWLQGLKEGTEGYLEFKKRGKQKSREQLGYYYGVILPMAVQAFEANEDYRLNVTMAGHEIKIELTLDNMDTFLKQRYAAKTGIHKDKSEMNMWELSDFQNWCIKWMQEWLNVTVPEACKDWREIGE